MADFEQFSKGGSSKKVLLSEEIFFVTLTITESFHHRGQFYKTKTVQLCIKNSGLTYDFSVFKVHKPVSGESLYFLNPFLP